ncbi:DNA cytosine methyltransferase [uncultured Eubacterium sp.]|uniref:DNA cytosine methyltransferase n=1 Tax=uncultured Eubacterium sp. TaxID=165185 RepID=UPI00261E7F3E|nr:DNA (cytosine-5-)-methyltransferase [uncultured Eubacterium sp.]
MPSVCSLFSGIGGIDLGFIQAGFDIVWANEMDGAACRTYRHNFPNTNLIEGDIKRIATSDIPDCDVLTAGFPCQPFSIAGLQKGFKDRDGNLFFEITRIIDAKRPKVVFLENVPNLMEHDDGKTFLVIFNGLAQFGYTVYYRVLASNDYGNLPQIRKRIYIVAIREDISNRLYQYPEPMELTLKSSDIINRSVKQHDIYYYTEGKMYDRLVAHMKDRKAIYRITDTEVRWTKNQMCPTLTANMGTHKDRVHVVWDDYGIRKMTLREGLDFQGFPKEFYFPNTITIDDAYKQIGNTVSVPVIARLATKIKEMLMEK